LPIQNENRAIARDLRVVERSFDFAAGARDSSEDHRVGKPWTVETLRNRFVQQERAMPIRRKFITVVRREPFEFDDSEMELAGRLEAACLIETHMSCKERLALYMHAHSLPPGFVACEVGSYLGASTTFLAIAAQLRGGHVHAVDTWQNDAMPDEPKEDTFERFLTNTREYREFITIHRGLASEMKHEVPPIDFLFIDGDHSYAGTKANLEDYVPKFRSSGWLALHDFDYDDVRRAVGDIFGPEATTDAGLTESLKMLKLSVR
jgi:hypothetical protein